MATIYQTPWGPSWDPMPVHMWTWGGESLGRVADVEKASAMWSTAEADLLEVAAGLVAWLNSRQVDAYFRVFSGHTQVNAGDLRQMRFPSVEQLRLIGALDLEPDEAVERVMGRQEVIAA